jgi:cellulose synthase/poly-beta-1,6-N-acetylglucosamine synthase-like glycosyltransferase
MENYIVTEGSGNQVISYTSNLFFIFFQVYFKKIKFHIKHFFLILDFKLTEFYLIPVITIILLIFCNFLLYKGVKRIFKDPCSITPPEEKFCSVVIAARNEETKIQHVIRSLKLQESGCFNLIIADDYSEDNTFLLAKKEANAYTTVIRNELPRGKKNSLATGIQLSAEEYILITDADCIPERKWVSSFLRKFSEGYDLLFGIAPLKVNSKLVSRVSAFENMKGFMLSLAGVYFNLPYSAAARSLGFKKNSFEKIGGYKNTMDVPYGDDGLLIREAVKNKLKIGVVTDKGSYVYSNPGETFRDYLEQRKRHTRTSFYYSVKVKISLALWHLINFTPFILFFFFPLSILFMIPLLVKLFFDSVLALIFRKKFGYDFKLHQIIYLQLIYEAFIFLHFFNALCGKVKWK